MTHYHDKGGLKVAAPLADFIEQAVLPNLGFDGPTFWRGAASIFASLTPTNRYLLARRDALQRELDAWHLAHRDDPPPMAAYEQHLRDIGYLVSEPAPFSINPHSVDDEVACLAGPQLVVPVLNSRFVLNAANARWGSLYDAFYGTDALPGVAKSGAYDPDRGAQVVETVKAFLDEVVPIADLRWSQVAAVGVRSGADGAYGFFARADEAQEWRPLAAPAAFAGFQGAPEAPSAILLRHHGLHIELAFDPGHRIGALDPAGLADVVLEAALSTIVDLEDSVAAVDAEDKVQAYAAWLGLMKGDLTATFEKNGRTATRALNPDRIYVGADGAPLALSGRSLLFVRNVGHLMTTPAVLLDDGSQAPEGILDAIVTGLIGLYDLRRQGAVVNSRAGSIYIVKPKMHGPHEAAFANDLFDAVEDLLGLPRDTIKLGLMDEERRTSANLAACIEAVRSRIMFINTGFLDRTGDEIHTLMQAGPMVPKAQMKSQPWIAAYETRNVQIGLACGFAGRAQIGKGMWAMPDRMADMLAQKIAHPRSGASTAWVPSPTAATLHAMHYHRVDVAGRQADLANQAMPGLGELLTPPVAPGAQWSELAVRDELDNNAQGILGYVVRWIDQGVGCSKVPDIHNVGLMEDRATLRISSQHIANWMLHAVASPEAVEAALRRMAVKVDAQNADDQLYAPMAGREESSLAFQAARALVFEGLVQPNGYTEPLLHAFRKQVKDRRKI